ncbi:MAG: Omp28-related outer membrane protein [candidate division WOR-3 bacterium]
MHVNSSYSSYGMYSAEARARFFYLPMPGTTYYTPWLWIDGDYSAGSSYSNWENLIVQRMGVPSRITARIWGNYNPTTRTGTIYARFISDTNATLYHNVLFVITEDSIYQPTPNGDLWHNHVARDYIPDHIGTQVTLAYQDSVTVSYPFSISQNWVAERCEIVTMIQDPTVINITKRIHQGAKIKLTELAYVGIDEAPKTPTVIYDANVKVIPNPCVNRTSFSFSLPFGTEYLISIFDAQGRNIRTLSGIASGKSECVNWNFNNIINAGVYFYLLQSSKGNSAGKFIVKK